MNIKEIYVKRRMYSSGRNNTVVLNKRVGPGLGIFFTFYRWKSMIWGKFQILLGEKKAGWRDLFVWINKRVDMLIRATRVGMQEC